VPLDPQARALLDQIAAAGIPPSHLLSVADAREMQLTRKRMLGGTPPPIANVTERSIPGPAGAIPVRLYTPEGSAPFPVLVYFHGGGWVAGNLDTHDDTCRAVANEAGCIVASIDYRLAPEHKFPAAAEDAYAATCWAAEHAAEIGADPERLAIGGDSAGGNLAAVVALMARDRRGPAIVHQLLVYPVTDYSFDTPSYRDNAEGYLLTRASMEWYWGHYLASDADGDNPYASPLRAGDLSGLPPALVITAEYDPLRDEGEAYAKRLREAGVPVMSTCYPGMIHGFFGQFQLLDQGKEAIRQAGSALKAAFGVREPVS
jgi:acetyl esterase